MEQVASVLFLPIALIKKVSLTISISWVSVNGFISGI